MKLSQVFTAALGGATFASAVASTVGTCEVATSGSNVVLPAEEVVLTEADVADYPELAFGEELGATSEAKCARLKPTCKAIPGDRLWPSETSWSILNHVAGGRLVTPAPIGSVCYHGPSYDAGRCANITAEWSNSDTHVNHPTSIMSPVFQGMSCLPVDAALNGHSCTLGGYPVHVLNAASARDIQAGVNFARNTNVRLVVKNTGHDFLGKSSGFGSLSIRTHQLKDIAIIKQYRSIKYTGPAIKAGSGVQGFELYAAASKAGLVAIGGEGMTVGWGGGYIQGGGHSPLSSIHGMAADQALAFGVVLADGRFVTADPESHPDVYWALRGGGGSPFGVVVSITVKAYPDMPTSISTFAFDPSSRDLEKCAKQKDCANDDFWAVIKHYFSLFPAHADEGIYSYFNIFPNKTPGSQTFTMIPYFAPRKTAAEVDQLLASTVKLAASLGISLQPQTVAYEGFYDAWKAGFPKEAMGQWNGQSGSRLFPRSNWDGGKLFEKQFDVIREVVSASYLIAFNIAPTYKAGGVTAGENAVLPAWRETVMHAISATTWDINERNYTRIREYQRIFTDGPMQWWRDVSPGMGAYLGESDINEPNRQEAFWGDNYPRLYALKQKYDPRGVFFAETAVGSEDWAAGTDRLGRLCPV